MSGLFSAGAHGGAHTGGGAYIRTPWSNGFIGGGASVHGWANVSLGGGYPSYGGYPYGYGNPYGQAAYLNQSSFIPFFGPGGVFSSTPPQPPPEYGPDKLGAYTTQVTNDLQLNGAWNGQTLNSTIPFPNSASNILFYRNGPDSYQIALNVLGPSDKTSVTSITGDRSMLNEALGIFNSRPGPGNLQGGINGLASYINNKSHAAGAAQPSNAVPAQEQTPTTPTSTVAPVTSTPLPPTASGPPRAGMKVESSQSSIAATYPGADTMIDNMDKENAEGRYTSQFNIANLPDGRHIAGKRNYSSGYELYNVNAAGNRLPGQSIGGMTRDDMKTAMNAIAQDPQKAAGAIADGRRHGLGLERLPQGATISAGTSATRRSLSLFAPSQGNGQG